MCCIQCALYHVQYVCCIECTVCIAKYAVSSVYCAVHTVQCVHTHSEQWLVRCAQCTVCSVQYLVHSAQCLVCSVQCAAFLLCRVVALPLLLPT